MADVRPIAVAAGDLSPKVKRRKWADSEWGRVAVAGSGFLADGYDLYVIGQVEKVLAAEYRCGVALREDCVADKEYKFCMSLLSSSALFGAVFGQVIFGTLADRLGRKFIFISTAVLIIAGSALSGLVMEFGQGPRCLLFQLVVCRGLLGFGIGGEYPLSATICSEGTAPRRRGTLMSLVFACQGLGYLLSSSLMLSLVYSGISNEALWRFALIFGAVVPMFSLYFRMQMHESDDFKKVQAARTKGDCSVDMCFTVRRYAWHLVGTAGNWFIFDIVFYANSLFNSSVTEIIAVGPGGLKSAMLRTLIIVLIMIPGYFVGVCFVNKLGRKNVQLQGYLNMAFWFSICGCFFVQLRKDYPMLFLLVYGLTFFFSNFGANLTTYVIPGEIYPAQAKATLHGISAACGKMGAFLGSLAMPHIVGGVHATDDGLRRVFFICTGLSIFGFVLTLFLTPRYVPDDLIPQEEGETVGFAPLFFQRKTKQSYWAAQASDQNNTCRMGVCQDGNMSSQSSSDSEWDDETASDTGKT